MQLSTSAAIKPTLPFRAELIHTLIQKRNATGHKWCGQKWPLTFDCAAISLPICCINRSTSWTKSKQTFASQFATSPKFQFQFISPPPPTVSGKEKQFIIGAHICIPNEYSNINKRKAKKVQKKKKKTKSKAPNSQTDLANFPHVILMLAVQVSFNFWPKETRLQSSDDWWKLRNRKCALGGENGWSERKLLSPPLCYSFVSQECFCISAESGIQTSTSS